MGKGGKKTITDSRLAVMLQELGKLKQQLLPEEPTAIDEELKDLDDFGKIKAKLNIAVQDVTKQIADFNEVRKKFKGERNARLIAMQVENTRQVTALKEQLRELEAQLNKDEKRKTKELDQEELAHRRKVVELFQDEIRKIEDLNGRLGISQSDESDPTMAAIERNQRKKLERDARRAEARERRRQRNAANGIGLDGAVDEEEPVSEDVRIKEQAFLEEKVKNDEQIDKMLDQVSDGLKILGEIALDINVNLEKQNEMLKEFDTKMDTILDSYKGTNKRLKKIIKDSGGMTDWCPILIVMIILAAIIGYLAKTGGK